MPNIKNTKKITALFNDFSLIGLFGFIILFSSCKGNDPVQLPARTVIVYMVANNNLDFFAYQNIKEMEKGWDSTMGNLIVYIEGTANDNPAYPVVYKIQHDTTKYISSSIQWVYPPQNSCSAPVLSTVINDIEKEFPANSYGLILWSHGSGWYPPGTQIKSSSGQIVNTSSNNIRQQIGIPAPYSIFKSFGVDGSNEMDIIDLKNALNQKFKFILFDACYMGCIEVAYELRNKANYIISSPTEVLSYGFPYQTIVPYLFNEPFDATKIASSYISSYQNQKSSILQSASVSVVNTDQFSNLISATNEIFSLADTLYNVNSLQQLDVNNSDLLYDFGDLYNHLNISESMKQNLQQKFKALIPYKNSTNQILNELTLNSYSGLSSYVLNQNDSASFGYYKKLDWYKDSGYGKFLGRFITTH